MQEIFGTTCANTVVNIALNLFQHTTVLNLGSVNGFGILGEELNSFMIVITVYYIRQKSFFLLFKTEIND